MGNSCFIVHQVDVLLFSFGSPVERGFFCSDDGLGLPYGDSTVTSSVLYSSSLLVPAAFVAAVEVRRAAIRARREAKRWYGRVPLPAGYAIKVRGLVWGGKWFKNKNNTCRRRLEDCCASIMLNRIFFSFPPFPLGPLPRSVHLRRVPWLRSLRRRSKDAHAPGQVRHGEAQAALPGN